jgi:primosomal protein N' (replication factor Y)
VLGPTEDVPARVLPVRSVVSPVRFFDQDLLGVLRWMAERYVAPLAAVIGRASPPRVASEEAGWGETGLARGGGLPGAFRGSTWSTDLLSRYRKGPELLDALNGGLGGPFLVRPAAEDEGSLAVAAVSACLASGRRAIVLVPEAAPVPATARGIVEAFGERVALYLGGDRRGRYRMWLDIASGRYDVVVGTRPAVFGPVERLGLVLVVRESHPAHREDRAPYYHVRDVALERARRAGAVCVLSALCPSAEAWGLAAPIVASQTRRWPPVEVVRPGPEGRASRLVRALRGVRRGFLFSPLPGYGIAQVCRTCGNPAACAVCGGVLRAAEGAVRCIVCEATGRCATCGGTTFGVRRGGAERIEEWASSVAAVPVRRIASGRRARLPGRREVVVGGPEAVRDLGVGDLDLVAILDADLADRRPGLAAHERAVSTWMDAIGWARPAGRAIVQSERPSDPMIQAIVRGNPDRFLAAETERRRAAGFPVGWAVFRVAGSAALPEALSVLGPATMLVSADETQTVCLVALEPGHVGAFGAAVRELAVRDVVARVEAEPHL